MMYAESYQIPLTFVHVLTILFLTGCKNDCRTEKKCFFSLSQLGHVIYMGQFQPQCSYKNGSYEKSSLTFKLANNNVSSY